MPAAITAAPPAPPAPRPAPPERAPFWREALPDLLARLAATAGGLASAEAAARISRYGRTVLRAGRRQTLLRLFVSRFRNPLVILLLIASAISALTGDVTSSVIVVVMASLSVPRDSSQEYRAGQAAERLRQSVAVRVSALRDGKPLDVPVSDLVPGDLVILPAGVLVPPDGRLVEARDCFVNQALLTGEPYPVEKHPEQTVTPDLTMNEAENSVFMGTSTVSGSARMLVCRTRAGTALGEIGASLSAQPPPTAFEIGTRRFGFLIMRLGVMMVLFVILVNILKPRPHLVT